MKSPLQSERETLTTFDHTAIIFQIQNEQPVIAGSAESWGLIIPARMPYTLLMAGTFHRASTTAFTQPCRLDSYNLHGILSHNTVRARNFYFNHTHFGLAYYMAGKPQEMVGKSASCP